MSDSRVISIVLNAHVPFAGAQKTLPCLAEQWFFEALSETYIPLLGVFDRLDADHIPFRLGISLSPTLCHLLQDQELIRRYLAYTDRQIEFGARECERTRGEPELWALAQLYYDQMVEKRILFTERYEGNILKILDHYQKKGRLELLATAATHAFLPLYAAYPEAVRAQLEVALACHRSVFGGNPQGFWLPEMGWTVELDKYLRAYNFSYTMVDAHGVFTGKGGASKGVFYPIMTPSRLFILIRDYHAYGSIWDAREGCRFAPRYRDRRQDVGYELSSEQFKFFPGIQGVRIRTGYQYWALGDGGAERRVYDPILAQELAQEHARAFLNAQTARLRRAEEFMEQSPVSFCAYDADAFGRYWHEGAAFLEALFREGARRREDIQFMNPGEYLCKQNPADFQRYAPDFSSWGVNGYAEMWLDASNDWMYRHVTRALDRMVELAERFPNDSGLKERALNQAAREILLVQASDWPKLLYQKESLDYARSQIEGALRNFTTIYESLGSNYISTEWLTLLERRHTIFPAINYRVFRKKR